MKITSKRIPLDSSNLFISATPQQSLPDQTGKKTDETDKNPDETGNPASSSSDLDTAVRFSLRGTYLPGYEAVRPTKITDFNGVFHPGCTGFPSHKLSMQFTQPDAPRINAWFSGNYHGVTEPESASLVKNRLNAIQTMLKNYFATAAAHNIFTSPFKIVWRAKFSDNTYSKPSTPTILSLNGSAPALPVYAHSISGTTLITDVDIRNIPGKLALQIFPDKIGENIDFIEIFATLPTTLYHPAGETAALRSATIDGYPRRCWNYDTLSPLEISDATLANQDFRLIATIPSSQLPLFIEEKILPMNTGILSSFSALPKLTATPTPTPSDSQGGCVRLATVPLSLSLPDIRKGVRGVTIDGNFDRTAMRFRLLGSDNRRQWVKIAETHGDSLRGIRTARFKWFKIEGESILASTDFIDAATFTFA